MPNPVVKVKCCHCWTRTVPATEHVVGVRSRNKGIVDSLGIDSDFHVMVGPRPPRVIAKPKGEERPRAVTLGVFVADGASAGDPSSDHVFDYGPAFEDRGEAMDWLDSSEGQAWAAESLNYMLFVFDLVSIQIGSAAASNAELGETEQERSNG
jgi:hypothetical protein